LQLLLPAVTGLCSSCPWAEALAKFRESLSSGAFPAPRVDCFSPSEDLGVDCFSASEVELHFGPTLEGVCSCCRHLQLRPSAGASWSRCHTQLLTSAATALCGRRRCRCSFLQQRPSAAAAAAAAAAASACRCWHSQLLLPAVSGLCRFCPLADALAQYWESTNSSASSAPRVDCFSPPGDLRVNCFSPSEVGPLFGPTLEGVCSGCRHLQLRPSAAAPWSRHHTQLLAPAVDAICGRCRCSHSRLQLLSLATTLCRCYQFQGQHSASAALYSYCLLPLRALVADTICSCCCHLRPLPFAATGIGSCRLQVLEGITPAIVAQAVVFAYIGHPEWKDDFTPDFQSFRQLSSLLPVESRPSPASGQVAI
jgi:hypothetical protein